MKITALVMAGGKGERLKMGEEKPLLKLCGKPMIQYVIEALRGARNIGRILVITSRYTRKTARKIRTFSIEAFEAPGGGYIADAHYVIKKLKLEGPVLIVSADLPFINSAIIDGVVEHFKRCGKPALSVMVPHKLCKRIGLSPDIVLKADDNFLVPAGINILTSEMIDKDKIAEEKMVLNKKEVAVNVNTANDLRIAEKIFTIQKGNRCV